MTAKIVSLLCRVSKECVVGNVYNFSSLVVSTTPACFSIYAYYIPALVDFCKPFPLHDWVESYIEFKTICGFHSVANHIVNNIASCCFHGVCFI